APARAALEITPPPGYELLYRSEQTVRFTIMGPRALVSKFGAELNQNFLKLVYNLTEADLRNGWATLPVSPDWLRPPPPERDLVQLKFRQISPEEVRAFVSPVKERKLPVEVRASITAAQGFRLAEPPSSSPAEVSVRGPAIAVDAKESIATEKLIRYDIRGDVHQQLKLMEEMPVLLDNGESVTVPLEVTPPSVTADVYVAGEKEREQVFENIPVLIRMPPDFPYVVELNGAENAVTVTVIASPANLRKLKRGFVKAYVDLESLAKESIEPGADAPYNEGVQVQLPRDVSYSAATARPEQVTLLLKNPAE
ncbi:MAG: YbbR-like domain-containing protein, partial [Planctomycetota bacterium]